MPSTSWNNETYPGGGVQYNEPNLQYSQTAIYDDAGTPRYNTVGEATSWSLENK